MNEVRKTRLLQELKDRCRRAQQETHAFSEEEWHTLASAGLEAILHSLETVSTTSPEHRAMREAIVLLHPHREAWKIISGFGAEIRQSPAAEQDELLRQVLEVLHTCTRASFDDLERHVYAFWPVPLKPVA